MKSAAKLQVLWSDLPLPHQANEYGNKSDQKSAISSRHGHSCALNLPMTPICPESNVNVVGIISRHDR